MLFGQRLRKLRLKNNLTQEELGKMFSTSKAAISNYENGQRKPDIELVSKIANCFNVSVDYLLGNSNREKIEWYDDLPPELQGFVRKENIDYMKILLDAKEKNISPEAIQSIIETFDKFKK